MKMTKKALLTVGMLAVTSAAFAAERSRMSAPGTDSAVDQPAPTFEMIEPNVAVVNLNGRESTLRADGAILLEDAIQEHGTVATFQRDALMKDVPMALANDGTRVYANGAVALVKDMIPTNEPVVQTLWTLEDAKENMAWGEREIGGQTVLAFANGAVLNTDEVNWNPPAGSQSSMLSVPQTIGADGLAIYADGRVVVDEQPLADPSGN